MLAGMNMLAAVAAEAAAEAAHQGGGGLPQLNVTTFSPQLFWLVVTFATLYFVLSKVLLPRIGEVIEERADRITRDIEAAQRLKSDPGTMFLPIIFLTARTNEIDFERARQNGADDYLTKPFQVDELVLAVDELIERSMQSAAV